MSVIVVYSELPNTEDTETFVTNVKINANVHALAEKGLWMFQVACSIYLSRECIIIANSCLMHRLIPHHSVNRRAFRNGNR